MNNMNELMNVSPICQPNNSQRQKHLARTTTNTGQQKMFGLYAYLNLLLALLVAVTAILAGALWIGRVSFETTQRMDVTTNSNQDFLKETTAKTFHDLEDIKSEIKKCNEINQKSNLDIEELSKKLTKLEDQLLATQTMISSLTKSVTIEDNNNKLTFKKIISILDILGRSLKDNTFIMKPLAVEQRTDRSIGDESRVERHW